jgi:hypothetical protein
MRSPTRLEAIVPPSHAAGQSQTTRIPNSRRGEMKTSEDARELGLYASECCSEELIFDKGDCFSRCPRCEGLCEWDLIENLTSWVDFEYEVAEEQAA